MAGITTALLLWRLPALHTISSGARAVTGAQADFNVQQNFVAAVSQKLRGGCFLSAAPILSSFVSFGFFSAQRSADGAATMSAPPWPHGPFHFDIGSK